VDLDLVADDLRPASVQTLDLAAPVLDLVPVPGSAHALVVHDDQRTVLGLLDPIVGTVSPFTGSARLDTYDFTAGGAFLLAGSTGIARLFAVDLSDLHPTDVRLDAPPHQVVALSQAIWVDHGDPLGRATILPSPTARREDAVVLSGFLVDSLLEEELP
jgi:hypothetical protein